MRARMAGYALAAALGWTASGRADCPTGKVVVVDNDIAGSGYSEEKPDNWTSYEPFACKAAGASKNTFRYLTKYSGDGSSTGKAIWTPKITVAGVYEVVTSYRASGNRTDDADYFLYGDKGETVHKVVSQKSTGTDDAVCTFATVGQVTCLPAGSCRLVLDGDDKLESAAADVTTFKLLSCVDEPPANKPPQGALDHVGCDNLSGWGYDPDSPATPTEVHLYFGGPAGSPDAVLGLPLKADIPRDDLCTAIQSCNHAFFVPYPDPLRDGVARPVHAYAIDLAGGPNTELPNSPMTASCPPLPQGQGGQGGADPGSSGSGGVPAAGGAGSAGSAGDAGSAGSAGSEAGGSAQAGQAGASGASFSFSFGGGGNGQAGGGGGSGGEGKVEKVRTAGANGEAAEDGGCAVRAGRGWPGPGLLLALGLLLRRRRRA